MGNKSLALLLTSCVIALTLAKPGPNTQLDKVTANDVAANAVVSSDKKADIAESPDAKKDTAIVQITGITTGAEIPPLEQDSPHDFKPQRAGSMFARFIDDIFQIPINILQNVSRLITSPFVQTKKAHDANISATS